MKKLLFWLLPIGWIGVIFYSSSQPYDNQDVRPLLENQLNLRFLEPMLNNIVFSYNQTEVSVDHLGLAGFIEFFLRKGAHVGVYFILACLFYLAFSKTLPKMGRINLVFAFVTTVSYAGLDEWHQSFTPNRTPYWGDVVLDAVGAFLAVLCIISINHWKKRRS